MLIHIERSVDPLAELYPRGIEQIAEMEAMGRRYDPYDPSAYVDSPEGVLAFARMGAEAYARVHRLFDASGTYREKEVRRVDYGCPIMEYRSGVLALGAGATRGSELTAQVTMRVHGHHYVPDAPEGATQPQVTGTETKIDNFGVELRDKHPDRKARINRYQGMQYGDWWFVQENCNRYLDEGREWVLSNVKVHELAGMVILLGTLTVVENKLYGLEPTEAEASQAG